ncbi:MAG: hypothetical protein QM666_03310 [Acinetobacter sp.]
MRNLWIGMSLAVGMIATTAAFAEPAVQPGETLESLSKAKVTTTVNGQPGSLQDLISSGKYQPVAAPQDQNAPPSGSIDPNAPAQPPIDPNAPAQQPPADPLAPPQPQAPADAPPAQ